MSDTVPLVQAAGAVCDPDGAIVALYHEHYRSLVRLAAVLLRDTSVAEDVVQDAFVATHRRLGGLNDPDAVGAYLRRCVVNGARSRLRRRRVAAAHPPAAPGTAASAETAALASVSEQLLLDELRRLPRRQREVLVLRFLADLSEAQTAAAMGISPGAVKSHTSRGLRALRGARRNDDR